MRWVVLMVAAAVVATSAVSGPRRCSGRLARERLKASEKIRDKRYFLLCCTPACTQPRRRPPTAIRRYQPFHKTWFGLKYGCNCSKLGSESNACDIRSGQCRCKPHVTGRACDTCEEGYWGLEQGKCKRCECGAGAAACDPRTGVCACAAGVGGPQCNSCLAGYYGFGPAGCLPCQKCTDGKVCSPESGRCVCPSRSRGVGCRQCAPGYFPRPGGCSPCRCGPGAMSGHCDPRSGQCKCKPGWVGLDCTKCAPGHFGPRCRPCQCQLEGTRHCEGDVCPCDEEGRCSCKENVVGDKCSACLQGTFGLTGDNPLGCTACFCFGRATHCTQASLTRAAIHAARPHHITLVVAEKNFSVDQNSLIAIPTDKPDSTIGVPLPAVPIYVELDKRFLSDQVTSYGGALRFTVEEEGGEPLPDRTMAAFPLVRLEGNNIVLNHYQRHPETNGSYAARFHESLWEVSGHSALASRPALMAALQRLDRILLRVTTRAPLRHEHVHALLLNVSLDTAVPGLSRSAPALGVELCDCTRQYSAPSCQEPAVGFWMPEQRVLVNNVAGTIVINVEGAAQPCNCNNRATACDPETGHCLNCTSGTGGPHCESCAEGYYGSASTGCSPCPCPSRLHNRAASCSLSAGRLQCHCRTGYAGPSCEHCAAGFYRTGDTCSACGCHAGGSVDARCSPSGACRCRPGAAGHKCDACRAPRTFLHTDGDCRECDNCTQTLLDSMEHLSNDLRSHADRNELNRIPKPFPALLEFAHNTSILQKSLENTGKHIQNSEAIKPLVQELEEKEHELFTEIHRLKNDVATKEHQAYYLSLESMSGLEEVLKHRRKIGEQVAALDDFARGERHTSAHRALKEAKHLLRQIKEIRLSDYLGGANDVFDSATVQSTAVQEYDYRLEDLQRRVRKFQASLDEWERKSADLQKLGDSVWAAGDLVAAAEKHVKPRLTAVRDTALRCGLVLEDIASFSANNLTDEVSTNLLRGQTLAIRFPSMLEELVALSRAAEEKEGILYNLTPVYKEKYVEAVEKHVNDLNEKAKHYKRVFAGALDAASLGVSAAHAWGAVAEAVRDASTAADAARTSVIAATATFNKDSVPKAAAKGINASAELKRRAAELLTKTDELRNRLESFHRAADVVSVSLRALGWGERALAERPHARVSDALQDANVRADRVFATMRALYDEAGELRRRARYNLRRRLSELQRHGDTQLGAAQEHVSQIHGNTLRGAELAEALAAAAAARAREHVAAETNISPTMQALKDKIARAIHAAQTITVSVASVVGASVGCSREYRVSTTSPAVTRMAVAVSFDNVVRDGPLLRLVDDSQEHERYMQLVVEKKLLRLSWNLGSGETVLTHPEELQPAHDDADQTTYRIEIERVWNTVHLSLERVGGESTTVSNNSRAGNVRLSAGTLRLGGDIRIAEELQRNGHKLQGHAGLPGCVHVLQYGDENIGLWAFSHQPQQAQCTGCTHRWSSSSRGAALVQFSGSGYAELRRISRRPPDARHFSIAFTFRTRDQNALLFLAQDTANNRSVSVILRDCRVVFLVQYSEARLEIATRAKHCFGRPAHVQATRVFHDKLERGSLRVNGEETLGSAEPPVQSAASLPDLTSAKYWVGGVAPGAPPASVPPLLGCLGALTVDRDAYSLMDTPARKGLQPVCRDTLWSAILEGNGFIELPCPSIRRKSMLGLTFRARAADGVLLYRPPRGSNADEDDDADDKHYLVLLLVAGELQVIASAGKSELRLQTNGTKFDDGHLHTLQLIRAHKQLELFVDEVLVSRGTLAGNALTARPRRLYLGGAGPNPAGNVTGPAFPTVGFTGTVSDLILDAVPIDLSSAVEWQSAALGRSDGAPADAAQAAHASHAPRALHAQHDAQDDAGCVKTASYTVEAGAVKFGDAAWSHAAVRLPPRARELTISAHFRTFRNNGLLLLIPGSKAKPKHFVALVIRDGKLKMVARGRKKRELSLAAFVADGTWRSVSVVVSRSKVTLTSGEMTARAPGAAPARGHRLLVGGLAAPPAPRTLPPEISRVGGLVGCVRRVTVGGRPADLVRDQRAVGQCFPDVEPAAYFAGDAYAWLPQSTTMDGEGDEGEGEGELRLMFRSSAPRGLLLATGNMLLELKDGKVMLTRYSWSGAEPSRVWAGGVNGRALCDGRWHAVRARPGALAVDGGPPVHAPAPDVVPVGAMHSSATPTRTPLYVGGIPEGSEEWPDGARENFKGCIRGVNIGGRERDIRDMHLKHVLLDSCPKL